MNTCHLFNPISLDLPVALRRNDSLKLLQLNFIVRVGSMPSIDVAEDKLRILRMLENCEVRGDPEHASNVLLKCIVKYLELNDGCTPI